MDTDMLDLLRLQLEADLPYHLTRRKWHQFETFYPREAVIATYDTLERFEIEATVMVSPADEVTKRHLVYVARAMDLEDDRGVDFQAARDLLEECKRLERTDHKLVITLEGGRPDPGSRSGPRLEVDDVDGGSRHGYVHGNDVDKGGQVSIGPRTRVQDLGVKEGIRATDRPREDDSRTGGT